jgi:hypothetical protein
LEEFVSMRTTLRAAHRLALGGALIVVAALAPTTRAADTPAEKTLPASTFGFLKVNNAAAFRENLSTSQLGQLFDDPALKPLKSDFAEKLEETNNSLKEKIGVTLDELLHLPEGTVSIAVVSRDDPEMPVAVLISADAGKNADKMDEVLANATKEAENHDTKVTTETYKDIKLTILRSTIRVEGKENTPMIWAHQGSTFRIATDLDALKDLIAHADGREESLASNESYQAVLNKVGADSQVVFYLDASLIFQLLTRAGVKNGADGEQIAAQLQLTGINGLKAVGGSFSFNAGDNDTRTRIFFYAPGPAQGVLKFFTMPRVDLKPEPWVPANVASYQTFSWDADAAWNAINELADQFAAGAIDNLEKALAQADPDQEPLSFKKDIFEPLGNRLTLIGDFKRPITEKSQRILISLALDDSKAFQNTLNKVFNLTKASPKKREFQGTTIYDFELPELPANASLQGPISMAIAKDQVFLTTDATLLEQVLRAGGAALADDPAYQAVARHFPEKLSSLSYERPEEQARLLYEMAKNGRLSKSLDAARRAGGDEGDLKDLIDPKKLPEFSTFTKYLTQGGGFGTMDEDGALFTRFTLRKSNP